MIEEDGARVMLQDYQNDLNYTHPMLVAGDPLWRNYRITAQFAPASDKGQSGIILRYRNDRCYYFCGVEGPRRRPEEGPPRDRRFTSPMRRSWRRSPVPGRRGST